MFSQSIFEPSSGGNAFDSLSSSMDNSSLSGGLSSAFDRAQASVGLGGFFGGNNTEGSKTLSLFDQTNPMGGISQLDNSNVGNSATHNVFNIRALNQGNLSITDKMRGIQGNRLDIDEGVSIAEMYADTRLDTRVGGGQYNVTISNIYQDEKLYKAYHGLFTDGKITERENYQIDAESMSENNSDFAQNKNSGGLEGQFLKTGQGVKTSIQQNSNIQIGQVNNQTGQPLPFGQQALPGQQPLPGQQLLPGQQPPPPPLTPLQKTLQPKEPVPEPEKPKKPAMSKEDQMKELLHGSLVPGGNDEYAEKLKLLKGEQSAEGEQNNNGGRQNPFEKAANTFKEKLQAGASKEDGINVLSKEEFNKSEALQVQTKGGIPQELITQSSISTEAVLGSMPVIVGQNQVIDGKALPPDQQKKDPRDLKAGLPSASAGVKAVGSTIGPNGTPNVMEQQRREKQAEEDKKNRNIYDRADEVRAETDFKKAVKWALNPVNRNTRNPYITKENYDQVMEEVKKAMALDFSISEEDKKKTFESMRPADEKVDEEIKSKNGEKVDLLEEEKKINKEKEEEKKQEDQEREQAEKEVDRIVQIREAQAKKRAIEERERNEKNKKKKKQEEELKKKPLDFSKTQTEMLEQMIRDGGGVVSFSELKKPGEVEETEEKSLRKDFYEQISKDTLYEVIANETEKINIKKAVEELASTGSIDKREIEKIADDQQKHIDFADLETLTLPVLSSLKRKLNTELETTKDEEQKEIIHKKIVKIQKVIASKIS